jgi:hypothetical protein
MLPSLLRSVFPYLSIMFLNEVDVVVPPMPYVMSLKCIIIIVLVFSLHGIFKLFVVNVIKCVLNFLYACCLPNVQCGCYECVVELFLFCIWDWGV